MKITAYTAPAHFRLFNTPCCHLLLCWVNPRLPNYCPECGTFIYAKLKVDGSLILVSDDRASIRYKEKEKV